MMSRKINIFLSIYNKLMSFSHSDELPAKYNISPELINERKKNLLDPLGRKDVKFEQVELDVPEYVRQNLDRYKEYILGDVRNC